MRIKGYILFIISYALCCGNAHAQPRSGSTTTTTTIETRVVEVTRTYERTIVDADRIAVPLKTSDTISGFTTSFTYKVDPEYLPVFSVSTNLQAAAIEERVDAPLRNYGYLRLGLSYPWAPLADLYLHNRNIKNSILSIYYNHRSYWANTALVAEQPEGYTLPATIIGYNAQHDLGVSLQHRIKNTLLHASFGYKRRYLLFHGHDTAYLARLSSDYPSYVDAINNDSGYIKRKLEQVYNICNAELGIASKNVYDGFTYNVNFTFGYTHDKAITAQSQMTGMPVSEYLGGIHGKIAQTFAHTHSGSLAFRATVFNKENAARLSDGLFTVTPAYEYQKDGISISVGANIEGAYNSHTPRRDSGKLSLHFFPDISFTAKVSDYFTAYARIYGQTTINTYQKTALENPYILPGLAIDNTQTPVDVTAGGKGRIFDIAGYNVFVSYAYSDNMYFYVNSMQALAGDPSDPFIPGYLLNNFDVVYNKTSRFTIGGDVDYTLAGFEAIARARYYFYSFNKSMEGFKAWHKPAWELHANLRYKYDEFTFGLGMAARGSAPVRYENPETGIIAASIKPYFDLSLQVEYKCYKWLSAFVYGNNLLNRHYQNYYLYLHHGVSGGAGVAMIF
ncbi:MAG: hypothetical protein LBF81_00135 [Prevotellaceae bacterium]|jgi:hypothetical protein|nr:hypothetical protein [Prevotellaceae bacterium]